MANVADLFEDQPRRAEMNETPAPQSSSPSQEDALEGFDCSEHIKNLKDILETGASDRDVSTKMEKVQKSVKWDSFMDIFGSIDGSKDYCYNDIADNNGSDRTSVRSKTNTRNLRLNKVLHSPMIRNVQVYKDNSETEHRDYTTHNDTILQMALRRSPPKNVLDFFSEVSESYRRSRHLFELIDTITLEDEEWIDIEATLKKIEKEQGDEKKFKALMKEICEIRHSWREDTLLSIATRRDPPLYIIKKLLSYAPETIHFRDTPRYDWMPFVYSLAYNAIPDVVKVLIPNVEIRKETNVLISKDVYDLTPLQWSLYYGAPVAVVKTLVDADISEGKESLHIRNSKEERPFEKAITASTDMAIVKELLPPDENIQDIEKAMVRSVIGLKSKVSNMKEYKVSPRTYQSLAEAIAKKHNLQRMLRYKSSESVATAIMVSECYAKIMFIVAFHNLSKAHLQQQQQLEEVEAEQEGVFFRANMLIDEERVSFILLCIALVYTIIREVHQMFNTGLAYVTSLWNWFDLLFIILSVFTLCIMLQLGGANLPNFDSETIREIILITSAIAWANLLFFIRSIFLPFAVFVSGLIGVFKTLIPFTVGVTIILCAFAQLYVTENAGTQECSTYRNDGENADLCLFDSAFLKVYGMFVGGIEIGELSNTPSMLIISAMFGFIVAILLLNIVIAIVSDKWAEVYEDGELHYWRNRLDFLAEVKGFDDTFNFFKRCGKTNTSQYPKNKVWPILEIPDKVVESVCRILWPRPDFWGHFDHIIDRVLSTKPLYGSFLWQFRSEWEGAGHCQKVKMFAKGILLILFFLLVCILWFVAGVLSFGILWPKSMRRFLLGHFIAQGDSSKHYKNNNEKGRSKEADSNNKQDTDNTTLKGE